MNRICVDEKWTFRRGYLDSPAMLKDDPGVTVNLPHDGMIGTPVSPDAPARSDMGYFTGGLCNYTRYFFIPREWENSCVGLLFDGAMMNASVDVNGCRAGSQHYGYAPFYIDLTNLVSYGADNRITVNLNTSMQPNSRWYTGSGLYRSVCLLHGPKIHIGPDGIFARTKEVADGYAFLETEIEICNETAENRLAEAEVFLYPEGSDEAAASAKKVIHVGAHSIETARIPLHIASPALWDADHPNLYRVRVRVKNIGRFRTHAEADTAPTVDEAEVLFGIRTVTADAVRGLQINGRTVKLKGGCLHHDNGLLGAVSLYETEARKIRKLKENGFNAIRTAHNPPSAALIEACDRVGMYVFDEAFDAWGVAKRGGDYSQYFDTCWEKDLEAFIRRDRSHPCVILWSTGNEIPERGGLNQGYTLSARLAERIRSLDGTRPVSNGICSFWCGLDDFLAEGMNLAQNAGNESTENLWEHGTEPFAAHLDVVGYNYLEDLYERDHQMFPQRVILGSENFPKEIGFRWPLVEKLPYVIGDFTWTAWDYLGEAGIGKAVSLDQDDPLLQKGAWALMPPNGSPFPWRTANDADFDITGRITPQGTYRSVVWGDTRTFLYSWPPDAYGKTELISPWGFPAVHSCWNYPGHAGKPVSLLVFSGAQEVEVFVNGRSIGRKPVSVERPLPRSVRFDTIYEPGKVEAVSYTDGKEVSRTTLATTASAARIRLVPEKTEMRADGHDLIYVGIEVVDTQGYPVPNAEIPLSASVSGPAILSGFGSANPVTDEDYTDGETVTFRGYAAAVLRAGYTSGRIILTVSANGLPDEQLALSAEPDTTSRLSFDRIGVHPAQILLPASCVQPETWACIACDQYTSEPAYWEKAFASAGDTPSALRLILPECFLKDSEKLIPGIHRTMAEYLEKGLLSPAVDPGFILCERTVASGTRLGLVCTVDLEQYSFEKGSLPLIRPTEQTIASRLPPRLVIRRGAPVELTHIMILIDDPDRTVLEPLQAKKASLRRLYSFDLMMNSGHLAGWALDTPEELEQVSRSLNALMDTKGEHPLLLAVGDGNHSLATAKAYWNEIRETLPAEERENHPARFALCEIVNIHDQALLFEPIHRIITGTSRKVLLEDWQQYSAGRGMQLRDAGEGHRFTVVAADGEETVVVASPEGAIPCETIQKYLDDFLSRHPEAEIDYIHGENSLRALAQKPETVGFLLPEIDKRSFFADVERLGVLPRKTFSMGEADEKRFYMEAKRI